MKKSEYERPAKAGRNHNHETRQTHNKRLMKLRPQQTLLPMVPHDPPDRLGHALLDGKVQARAVVDKLGVDGGVVLRGRGKPHGAARLRRLGGLPRPWRVHDDGLVGERRRVTEQLWPRRGLGLGLGVGVERGCVWLVQGRQCRGQGRHGCYGSVRWRLVLVLVMVVVEVMLLLLELWILVLILRAGRNLRLWGRLLELDDALVLIQLVLRRRRRGVRVRVRVRMQVTQRLGVRSPGRRQGGRVRRRQGGRGRGRGCGCWRRRVW